MSAYGFTTGYGFTLINYQTQNWQTEEYDNWRRLDMLLQSLEDLGVNFAKATGAVNAYVVVYDPPLEAYTVGTMISFSTNAANTNAATVNVNGLGAKNLFRDGAALTGGELANNEYVKAVYDGVQFAILEPRNRSSTINDGTITHQKLTVGHPVWDASGNLTATGTLEVDGAIRTGAGDGNLVLSHNNAALTSGQIFFATTDPTGGANGDIWFKHAA